ncbi:MAG: cbb3-type cytochrome oxidase assembly protein CcoS [Planctomycetota bacterium]
MSVIYIVLPMALVLGGAALGAFLWAVKRGQFDDLDTPAIRVALEGEEPGDRKSPSGRKSGPTS